MTTTIQFRFTALNVNGNDVVASSTPHLGVALFYKGKKMGLNDKVTESFGEGYTNVEMQFEAVRDPDVPLSEIPTGDFKASAVMVLMKA